MEQRGLKWINGSQIDDSRGKVEHMPLDSSFPNASRISIRSDNSSIILEVDVLAGPLLTPAEMTRLQIAAWTRSGLL